MFGATDIEQWNSIFVNGKIQESDLKQPTELFVVRSLVAFLETFGYKVAPPFPLTVDSENTREKRLFLIRLTKTIDRILKCSNKSNACLYLDIIKPVPKRTADMFEILLNHYYYYAMFVDDVFKIEQKNFQKRNDLIRDIDKQRQENLKKKDLALQMKDAIAKLSIALPATAKEIEKYSVETKQRREDLSQLKVQVEQLQEKFSNLKARQLFLESQVVDNEEVSTLKIELKQLQNNIAELDTQNHSIQADLSCCKEQLMKMDNLKKSVEEFKTLIPTAQLQEYEDIIKKLEENEMQIANLKHDIDTLNDAIKKLSGSLTNITDQFKSKKQTVAQESRDLLAVISENQMRFKEDKKVLNALKRELQDVQSSIDEQTEMYEYMLKEIDSLMSDYKMSEN